MATLIHRQVLQALTATFGVELHAARGRKLVTVTNCTELEQQTVCTIVNRLGKGIPGTTIQGNRFRRDASVRTSDLEQAEWVTGGMATRSNSHDMCNRHATNTSWPIARPLLHNNYSNCFLFGNRTAASNTRQRFHRRRRNTLGPAQRVAFTSRAGHSRTSWTTSRGSQGGQARMSYESYLLSMLEESTPLVWLSYELEYATMHIYIDKSIYGFLERHYIALFQAMLGTNTSGTCCDEPEGF